MKQKQMMFIIKTKPRKPTLVATHKVLNKICLKQTETNLERHICRQIFKGVRFKLGLPSTGDFTLEEGDKAAI